MSDLKLFALSLALSASAKLAVGQQPPAGTTQPVSTVTLAVKGTWRGQIEHLPPDKGAAAVAPSSVVLP